jgi:hypothetical protein
MVQIAPLLEEPVAKGRKRASSSKVPKLPRVPLPRQAGHRHEDEKKKPWRDRKHKKPGTDD